MYKSQIEADLKRVLGEMGYNARDLVVYINENVLFGDYATNIALQQSKQKPEPNKQSNESSDSMPGGPRALAEEIVERLGHPVYLERIDIAGPGFINFFLKDQSLLKLVYESNDKKEKNPKNDNEILAKRYLIEYADPNTHKAFHIGHLRTLITGESISRMLEFTGNEVFRVNYGSDIGPTVAKCLWAIAHLKEEFEKIKATSVQEKVEFLGRAYVYGNDHYEKDEEAKKQIDDLTKKLYERDSLIMEMWDLTKNWSLGYFETIYSKFGVEFDLRVNESEVDEIGKDIVLHHIGSVFEESEGAIVFRGEKYGLHTRVFITSNGNPLYETKEVGLVVKYQEKFPFDQLLTLSDARQESFFEVANKAISLIDPHLEGKKHHFSYGTIDLTSGKMSSRAGNVVTADELLELVKNEIIEGYGTDNPQKIEKIALAAIKFYFLKYAISSNILIDLKQAVALHGDSGPYILYTYARINSILEKARNSKPSEKKSTSSLEPEERDVLRQLEYFEAIAERSAKEFSPNDLANYLLNLAKAFNAFYEKYPVLSSEKEEFRLKLGTRTAETLKLGAYLLGFEVLDKM